MQNYEIYALRYAGPFTSSGAFLMWLRGWEKVETRNYYFWCLKGPGETVIVDAGVPASSGERKRPSRIHKPRGDALQACLREFSSEAT